jgi:PAS domain S-box-containing protein
LKRSRTGPGIPRIVGFLRGGEPELNEPVGTPPASDRRQVRGRRLTDKQTLVLELVAEGLENKEIAHRMGLSEQAVKEHVSALLHRLAVRNRAALAEIATELKIAGTTELEPQWLTYIYQQSNVMSAVVRGPDHIFVSANDAFRRGAGTSQIIGRPFIEVFPANPQALPLFDEVLATGQPKVIHEIVGRWLRGDSLEDGYADVALQPLPGTESGIGISVVDVTEQVLARQSLAQLSAEQLALLDVVPNGIVVIDRTGAVVKVNRAAQTLLGSGPFKDVSSESAKRYRLRDAVTGRDLPAVEQALARALDGEALRDLRIRMFLPALGRDASVRIDAEPLRAADGTVRAVVAAIAEVAEAGDAALGSRPT